MRHDGIVLPIAASPRMQRKGESDGQYGEGDEEPSHGEP